MIIVGLDHKEAAVSGNDVPKHVFDEMRIAIRYRQKGWEYSEAAKRGWDGYIFLAKYYKRTNVVKIPAGLLHVMLDIFDKNGMKYKIKDLRVKPKKSLKIKWVGPELRDYQELAVRVAKENSRGIWDYSMSAGKMLTAARLIQELGVPTLMIVNRMEAMADTYKEFSDALSGIEIGRYDGKVKNVCPVTITTPQSLLASIKKGDGDLYEFYNGVDAIIVDEAHHLGAKASFYDPVTSCEAYYKIGMSGTVFREDGRDILITAAIGPIIGSKTAKELETEGFTTPVEVRFVPVSGHNIPNAALFDKAAATDMLVRNSELRNDIIKKIVNEIHAGTPFVVGVTGVEHGQSLSAELGVPFVSGTTNKKERAEIQKKLDAGEIIGVVSTVYDQSVNIKRLGLFIVAGGGTARTRSVQQVGRVIRRFQGKDMAYVYDFHDIDHSELAEDSAKRSKGITKAGFKVVDYEIKIDKRRRVQDSAKIRESFRQKLSKRDHLGISE